MIKSMIIKNLKIIFRNPYTLIVLILAPILLMLIVGISFSGSQLNNVNVGIISNNKFLENINYDGLNFIKYNKIEKCIANLKKSNVDLCIKENVIKDQNTVKSIKVNYYVDNTRSKLSNILINSFNRFINEKTKDISSKTINSILKEIHSTTEFMKESNNFLQNASQELNQINSELNYFNNIFKKNKKTIIDTSNDIILKLKILNSSLSSMKNKIDYNLNEIDKNLLNIININNDFLNEYDDVIYNLNYLALSIPAILNYTDFDELNNLKNNLEKNNQKLIELEQQINNLKETNSNIDINKISKTINELTKEITELKNKINDGEILLNNLITETKKKKEEMNKISDSLNKNMEYYNQLSEQDSNKILEPISKKESMLLNNLKMIHKLTPTIIILILLFIGILLSNIVVSLEINSKAYFRNLISPASQNKFVFSLFITNLLIMLFQISFLFLILYFFFGFKNIFSHFILLAVILIHLISIFSLIGIFLAYYITSNQMSILISTFLILFMLLLSSIIIPIKIMPAIIGNLVNFNPVVIGENMIRKIFFFSNINSIHFINFLIFDIYIIILIFLVNYAVKKRSKELF